MLGWKPKYRRIRGSVCKNLKIIFKMLIKIKNYLSNKKLILALFCFLFLVGLLFPFRKAEAFIGTGIFDYFNTALGGVEEGAGPLAGNVIKVFFFYIIGIILLYFSSYILQTVITESPKWLVIQNSALVQSGWHFVAGLANLFLILIFVAIAIAYILKIETFQAKKALPKLIIVALLLNFSLVFVGILVDISRILFNTVLAGNETLITDFINVLGLDIKNIFTQLFLWLVLLVGLWVIPFIGPFSQLFFAILMLSGYFTNIITWIFQIICSFMISAVFFLYIFLFAARVFVIQLLAIISPFAFVCMILPQTQKWWDEWLKHLLQWTFLGIVLLFFLAIGLRAAHELVPPGGLTVQPVTDLSWVRISAIFTYYFFIFIYLILVGYVSNRFMPVLAAFIISQATAWGQRAKGLAKPFASVVTTSAKRVGKEKVAPWVRGKLGEERTKKWATAPLPGAEEKGMRGALKRLRSAPTWGLRRGIAKAVGPTAIEAEKREIGKGEGEAEKIRDPTLLLSQIREAIGAGRITEAIGLLSKAIEKGGGFKKEVEKGITDKEAILLAQKANAIKAIPEAERIGRLFAHKKEVLDQMGFETPDVLKKKAEDARKRGKEEEAKKWEEDERELRDEWKELKYKTIQDKLIAEARKPEEIKGFAKGFWKTPEVMEAVQRFWGGPQLGKAADEFGREFVDAYMEEADKRGIDWFLENNQKALLYRSGGAAQDLGFRSPEGLSRNNVRNLIEWYREEERKKKT